MQAPTFSLLGKHSHVTVRKMQNYGKKKKKKKEWYAYHKSIIDNRLQNSSGGKNQLQVDFWKNIMNKVIFEVGFD